MAVAGGVAMTGGATVAAYKFYKHKQKKVEIQSSDSSEISIVESSVSVALSEKQMKQIAELGKAYQEGFLSYADFEKRVNDIIIAATAHSNLDEIESFILSNIENVVTLDLLKDIFNRLK